MVTAAELLRARLREWIESGSEIQMTSYRSLHAKYMWLMCARPRGDTVDNAHRGAAFIRRRATRSSFSDENRCFRCSTVTSLVWSPRPAEGDRRRDRDDLPVLGLDQLPTFLVHHSMVPPTQKDQVVEIRGPAVDPVK